MTESIAEVRAALAAVSESLGSADHHARVARARLSRRRSQCCHLDREHPESLVPPELHRASEQLDHGLAAIDGGRDAVTDLNARL